MNFKEEKWRQHKTLDYIWISNQGRIWRESFIYRHRVRKGGGLEVVEARLPAKYLSGSKLTPKGYPRIRIGGKTKFVHRLIAEYWLDNPDNKPQINHKDGNKLNNSASNLEWVTNQENRDHAVKNNLICRGSECPNSVLQESDVRKIKALLSEKRMLQRDIAKMFGVRQQLISKILLSKVWKHI